MRREGSITPWQGGWRIRLSVDGKRRSLGVHETKEKAEAVLAAALVQLAKKNGPLKRNMTLRVWGERFLDERELAGLHRSIRTDRSMWRSLILSQPWADEPVRSITTQDVAVWVRGLLKTRKRQTVANALNSLRVALSEAVAEGVIPSNPAYGVKVPKQPRSDVPGHTMTGKEVAKLLASGRVPERVRTICAIAIYTGLRAGELWGLRWNDVHLDGSRPRLVVRHNRNLPTKTGLVREVPLLTPAIDALRRWREGYPADRRKQRGGGQRPQSLLVFPSETGGCHTEGYDARWSIYRERINMKHVRFHDFRHTCASQLVSGAWGRVWSLEEVRQWLGHASIKTTERYAHFAPGNLHDAARAVRLSGHFGDTKQNTKRSK